MRVTISPIYFFKKKKNREGKTNINVRIRINKKKNEFVTGIYVFPEYWNAKYSRSVNDIEANKKLSELESKLQEIADKMYYEKREITSKAIAYSYKGKSLYEYSISKYFDYYLYETGKINILAKGYSAKFVTLNNYLLKFTKKYYDTSTYDLNKVNYKFILEFDVFLKGTISEITKKRLSKSYIQRNHSMFRTVLISAYKSDVIRIKPYDDFPIREVKTEIKYLTLNELNRLKSVDLSYSKSLQEIRDIFLFTVYTGLRYRDAQAASVLDIEYEDGIRKYLIKHQQKTKDKVEIPLLKVTLDLIDKYENTDHRLLTGCLMPKYINSLVNKGLKTIGRLAHIRLSLSHHVARHTCATTILLENDVSLHEVSKWLGHADIKSTKVYAHVTRNKLGSTAGRLNVLFKDE